MGTRTAVPVEEYLHTAFPGLDREYRDGELQERTVPDYLHGRVQGFLFSFFANLERKYLLFPTVETRVRLRPGLFLIPDVCVFQGEEPSAIPWEPPLVAIEILSPDDRLTSVREKLEEYRAWGVPHVWLVDPHSRRFYACDTGFAEVTTLEIPELGIQITPADFFRSPDPTKTGPAA